MSPPPFHCSVCLVPLSPVRMVGRKNQTLNSRMSRKVKPAAVLRCRAASTLINARFGSLVVWGGIGRRKRGLLAQQRVFGKGKGRVLPCSSSRGSVSRQLRHQLRAETPAVLAVLPLLLLCDRWVQEGTNGHSCLIPQRSAFTYCKPRPVENHGILTRTNPEPRLIPLLGMGVCVWGVYVGCMCLCVSSRKKPFLF